MILGWREWVALPDLGIAALKAKLDTGALSSSIHVEAMERFSRGGSPWVRFQAPNDESGHHMVSASAPVVDERVVKDSGGHRERRIVIETHLEAGGARWPIELTLTQRHAMTFWMLVGRQALRGRIMVDPSHSYCAGRATTKGVK